MTDRPVQNDATVADRPAVRTSGVGRCPLCAADRSEPFFRAPDRLHGTPGIFVYRRCTVCRTVYQDPRVVAEDLGRCYPGGYYTHVRPGGPPSLPLLRLRERLQQVVLRAMAGGRPAGALERLGALLSRFPAMRARALGYGFAADLPRRHGGRALDAGCGSGVLLTALVRAGWTASGVEVDEQAAAVAREVSGQSVRVGDFRTADLPCGHFDLVVLRHVFEHLDDPRAALSRIAELLAPGGRGVLIYPNPHALGARLYRRAWYHWDPPRHLVLTPVRALAAEARRHGLIPLRARTRTDGAASTFAKSRAYRRGGSAHAATPNVRDRLLAAIERALVAVGLGCGEEAVLVVGRPAGPAAARPAESAEEGR